MRGQHGTSNRLVSGGYIGPILSALAVFGLAAVPYVAVLAFSIWRAAAAHRLERLRKRADSSDKLQPGPALVTGTVIAETPGEPAIRLEVHQKRPGTTHKWREQSRHWTTKVFAIRLASGDQVPVVPGGTVKLLDDVEETIDRGVQYRTRVVDVSDGEQVFVIGNLAESDAAPMKQDGGGYRSAPQRGLALQPPRRGELLVSTDRPGAFGSRFARRRLYYIVWAVATALLLVLFHGVLFADYHLQLAAGEVHVARVIDKEERPPRTDGPPRVTTYWVEARTLEEPRRTLLEEVHDEDFRRIHKNNLVTFRLVPDRAEPSELGSHATTTRMYAELVLILAPLFVAGFIVARRRTQPWYNRRKFDEYPKEKLQWGNGSGAGGI